MEIAAREATAEDLDLITDIRAGAVEELRPLRGGEMWARRERDPSPLHTAPGADALVIAGMIDGTVVGYAAVRRLPLHDGTSVGDLTDLYVLPGARGVGVGESMMELLSEWCRDAGCLGIDAVALPGDRATKNFFETFGLVARAIRVHRAL